MGIFTKIFSTSLVLANLFGQPLPEKVATQGSRIDRLEQDSTRHYMAEKEQEVQIYEVQRRLDKIESQNEIILRLMYAVLSGIGGGGLIATHQFKRIIKRIGGPPVVEIEEMPHIYRKRIAKAGGAISSESTSSESES